MAAVEENLRAYLLDSVAITDIVEERIHENVVPEDQSRPYVWIMRRSVSLPARTLDGNSGFAVTSFDVECIGTDIAVVLTLAAAIKAAVDGQRWLTYTTFVEDEDDDYIPRGNGSDEGLQVAALSVDVIGYDPQALSLSLGTLSLDQLSDLTDEQLAALPLS